ncbi:hypothetical protein PHMEG_00012844 [Phytophthora megakarya]|uniref:Uncharacterized protein n=1 Tax=Phytophthora megakarya TaxID=4795 RepID=A0A225W994_9STRA|nr:hypothetical protein PHMEG_00012844 [Phytophthora megakarya]
MTAVNPPKVAVMKNQKIRHQTLRRILIDLCDNDEEDLNTTQLDTEDYVRFDSGDELEEDDLSDLDGINFGWRSLDEDDDEVTNEEHKFADHCSDSTGRMDKVLASEVLGPTLEDTSHTGWHDHKTPDFVQYFSENYTRDQNTKEYPERMKTRYGSMKVALK